VSPKEITTNEIKIQQGPCLYGAYTSAMLSQADRSRLKIDCTLETFREACTDSGILNLVDQWIKDAKKQLAEQNKPLQAAEAFRCER
jgi:hypothetical protein